MGTMNRFEQHNGELLLGGVPLSRLVARVGQTPFYAIDRGRVRDRVAQVRQALPPGMRLHYAVKANPMPALLSLLGGLVDGMDVASAAEMRWALDAGTAAQHIGFAGPGKRESELRQAVAAGVRVNAESAREIDTLARLSDACGWPARVALRLNPDFELRGAGMRMGGGAKPFGVDVELVRPLLQRVRERGLNFEGFHLYAGSQMLNATLLAEGVRRSTDLVCELADAWPEGLRHVNLGGGWGIPYTATDGPLDLGPVSEALARACERLQACGPQPEVVTELGRYLVGEAGVYVAQVLDRKVSRGHTFLVTDGGLHQHLAATGNLGQVLRRPYPLAIGNRMAEAPQETVSIVGPLCTPLDVLAERVALPEAHPGDWVVVFQSGAYGATASPQAFLGHPACVDVLV